MAAVDGDGLVPQRRVCGTNAKRLSIHALHNANVLCVIVALGRTSVTSSASWLSVSGLASSRYFCARSLPKGSQSGGPKFTASAQLKPACGGHGVGRS